MLLLVVGACSSFEDAPPGGPGSDAGVSDTGTTNADADAVDAADTDAGDAAVDTVLPFDDALIARWKFDETSGNVAAEIVNGNDATLEGTASFAKGKIGGALKTGGSGLATVDNHPTLNLPGQQVSVAMWVNLSKSMTDSYLFTYAGAFNIKLNARAPQIAVNGGPDGGGGGAARAAYNVPLDEWVHLSFVFKDGVASIYVDGLIITQMDNVLLPGAVLESTGGGIVIGTDDGTGINYANGSIDDVRMYKRALDPDELLELAKLR